MDESDVPADPPIAGNDALLQALLFETGVRGHSVADGAPVEALADGTAPALVT
jgi:hypothetical protein